MNNIPSWLKAFFGENNLLCLEKVLSNAPGAYAAEQKSALLPLVKSALDGEWPIILPWCDRQHWVFFAIAENERTLQELTKVINARLGSADVDPDRRIYLSPTSGPTLAAESALLEHSPTGFIRIELLEGKREDKQAKMRVFAALKEVIDLFRLRPSLVRTRKRPFGRILSDFMLATNQKEAEASNNFLQELRDNGLLSKRNLLLLELQQAGKWQNWDALLNHHELPDLIRGRIPSSLTRMLLAAYQHRYLGHDVLSYTQETPSALRPAFLALQPLFMQVPLLGSEAGELNAWRSWAIGVALAGEHTLLSMMPDALKSGWLQELKHWAELKSTGADTPSSSPVSLSLPTTLESLASYLQSSLTATAETLGSYAEMLSTIDPQLLEQAQKTPLLKTLIESINRLAAASITGWDNWFSRLREPDADRNALMQIVALDSEHWPATSFQESAFLHLLVQDFPPHAFSTLRNAMPAFIEWLRKNQLQLQSTTWLKWMDVLAMEQSVSPADIKLATLATEYFLQGPLSRAEYQNFVATLQLIIERCSSLKNLASLGEMMELLLDAPEHDNAERNALWMDIQTFAVGVWPRLDHLTRAIMRSLAINVLGNGADSAFPPEPARSDNSEPETLPDLSGKRVAIYTLTEGAARRARGMIEMLFQGIRVDVNHDHTATDKLVNLAKQADYFIFAAASAKHQALYAITPHRRDLIYPEGKGAGSILNAFVARLQQPMSVDV
ncbi:protein DpdD [Enterobacter sp.]|uniref:protein DpdD n=1 Tax=Enterobacter sp. TaxID=42895 RepID=UPI00296F7508|nr:protein DpdD [Enterobacter sp.]